MTILLENYGNTARTLLENYGNTARTLLENYDNTARTLLENYGNTAGTLLENYDNTARTLLENYGNTAGTLLENYGNTARILLEIMIIRTHASLEKSDLKTAQRLQRVTMLDHICMYGFFMKQPQKPRIAKEMWLCCRETGVLSI